MEPRRLSRWPICRAGRGPAAQCARAGCGGFTLIELLVVIVIIGVVVTGALLSLGATGQDRQLQGARDRLAALISYARDRGAILTVDYGIVCGTHGYRFTYYDDQLMRWQPATLDRALRLRHLPPGLSLRLVIEGRHVVLSDHALKIPASKQKSSASSPFGPAGLSDSGDASIAPAAGSGASGSQSDDLAPVTDDNTPQIMLLSSGDMNSFSLTIVRDSTGRSATLSSTADDDIRVGKIVEDQP